ncbi:phosphodiester glycosidase family protein [Microbacterium halotolerans]|uniref:phosphodiester glycosidase family protein n=1 Tax=Microbacterium halotolerans TaxID=246613 RepID=UPI000E6AA7C5|nr:phosphodiester glycosidase family protein [Microbacterium halotolerans]
MLRTTHAGRTTLAGVAAATLAGSLLVTLPASAASDDTLGLNLTGGDSALVQSESQQIAPGLDHVNFSRIESGGWVTGNVLVADLTTPTLSMDVVDSGAVSTAMPVSQQVEGLDAVAAINGDYFDMNATNAPIGTNVTSSGIRTGSADARQTFTVSNGVAAVQALTAQGTITTADGVTDIRSFNSPSIPRDGVGVYTAAWGEYTLDNPVGGPSNISGHLARATVVDGIVTATDDAAGAPEIPEGGHVLLGREEGADAIGALQIGDEVAIEVGPSQDVDIAVAGSQRLVIDGEKGTADQVEASRTAIGVNRDGTEVYVVAIDGRAADSRGQTVQELAQLMIDLGAHNAVNLDGGGSTTMLARPAGSSELEHLARPSDGSERAVANSLAFFSSAEPEIETGAHLAPAVDGGSKVFPGYERTLAATGLDANFGAVAATGSFGAGRGLSLVSQDDASAVVTGTAPGKATATFTSDAGSVATASLRVLGDLERIEGSTGVVSFIEQDEQATFRVTGFDGDGHAAPIEAADITIAAGEEITVEQTGIDAFTLRPTVASGATTLRVDVGPHRFEAAVTIGLAEDIIVDFDDADDWSHATARATGSVSSAPGEGPEGQDALRLMHDFTTSTATRGSYAIAPEPVELPGQPRAVTMWINGDGTGAWPRLQVRPAGGSATNIDGPTITWEGWRKVTFTVPAGTAYPLTFERIRIMETRSTSTYDGDLLFSDLGIVYAPEVDQPAPLPVDDQAVISNGTADAYPLRIATMNDAQFVARNPNSPIVEAARETLREMTAAEPDLIVINGDFTDEAAPADFALAQEIIDESIDDAVPYVYVPGNHEIMGGEISNFEDAFGDTRTTQDLKGTRVITLNSAPGTLGGRGSNVDQLAFLDEQLAGAAADPSITGVTVFFHHPTRDHLVGAHSQLSDRVEARRLEQTFADFRATSGKSIAVLNGHVGNFDARSDSGVSYVTLGNSGKNPSGPVERGGFTGWAMVGIDPAHGVVGADPIAVADRTAWMRTEIVSRIDSIALAELPESLPVGATADVSAVVTQDDTREVPVAWPMSATWGGDGVVVDDGSVMAGSVRDGSTAAFAAASDVTALEAEADVVRLNSATGTLTAVAPGTATVSVTVNGVTTTSEITVQDDGSGDDGSGDDPGDDGPDGGPGDGDAGDGDSSDGSDGGPGTPGADTDAGDAPSSDTGTDTDSGAAADASDTLPATGSDFGRALLPLSLLLATLIGGGIILIRRGKAA